MDENEVKQPPEEQVTQPAEVQSEQSSPKTPRYRELLSKHYPDRQFDTDEDAENAFYEDYEQKSSALKDAEVSNQEVFALIEANPALADVIIAMNEGEPFEVALAKCVDLEALTPSDGEPNFEEYKKAVSERKQREAEIKSYQETRKANSDKSKADANEFYDEKGMDADEQDAFVSFVEGFYVSLLRGEISKATLTKMYQAFKYDEDVADAAEQGEINGRNAQIEAKRTTNAKTDGIPTSGGAVPAEVPPTQKHKVFNI